MEQALEMWVGNKHWFEETEWVYVYTCNQHSVGVVTVLKEL